MIPNDISTDMVASLWKDAHSYATLKCVTLTHCGREQIPIYQYTKSFQDFCMALAINQPPLH